MRKNLKALAAALALATAGTLFVLTGCATEPSSSSTDDPSAVVSSDVSVTSVTLTAENDADTLLVGGTLQLTATVVPDDATNKTVTWETDDPAVATVDGNGLVTGVGEGTVRITVTTEDGSKTASLTLTVTAAAKTESVEITPADVLFGGNLVVGGSVTLEAEIASSNADGTALTWSSGNEEVAAVDENGVVTAVAAGTAVIKATADDGSGVSGEYTVYVYEAKTSFTGENAALKGCAYNSAEQCVGSLTAGATISFTIVSESAQTVSLQLDVAVTSEADASFAKQFASVTVGGVACSPESDAILCGTEYGWSNHGTIVIRNVQLSSGENEIVITAAENVSTNLFSFVVFSASSVTEKVETPITEGTSYYFEGEDAEITAGSLGTITVSTSDSGAKNSTSLQNINNNSGATLTYTVYADAACLAGLYCNLAFGSASVSDIFTLTVNGESVEIPSSFTATGTANWATYEEYWLANIDLVQGSNTIVLTITGGCGNYDYMKLVTDGTLTVPSAVTAIALYTEYELLATGDSVTLTATVSPSGATDKTLTWSSSDTSVATVDSDGKVSAVAEGSALITATANDGSGVSFSMRIFVSDQTATRYEAEDATLTNCSIESNGTFVGGINNEGAMVTFTVASSGEKTVLFRISSSVVNDGDSIVNFYTVKLNGVEVDLSQGTFASRGSTGWNTESGFFTMELTLADGDNTIELCSVGTSVSTTLDWIEII